MNATSGLERSVETPVLDRFGNVGDPDRRLAGEVGYGAGKLEHPVIGARRELGFSDPLSPHRAGPLFCWEEAVDGTRADLGGAFALAHKLSLMRPFHARSHRRR